MTCFKMLAALNGVLPRDITVRRIDEEPPGSRFHARYSARGKHYRYWIDNGNYPSPLDRRSSWHLYRPLDLKRMQSAAAGFVGKHDFRSFSKASDVRPMTTRTITQLELNREAGRPDLLRVDVVGDGFLWNMVRCVVGTLTDVGRGRMEPGDVERILGARDRQRAGPTAPPQGLTLMRVFYDEPLELGAMVAGSTGGHGLRAEATDAAGLDPAGEGD